MNAYYLVQLNGWHDLVNRFTPTVMADVWGKLVCKVANLPSVTSCDYSLMVSDASANSLVFRENPASGGKLDRDFVSTGLLDFFSEFLGVQSFLSVDVDVWTRALEQQPDILELEAQFRKGKKLHCSVFVDGQAVNSLAKILEEKRAQSYLQPIVNLKNRKVIGYEMLTRGPSNSNLYRADKLFSEAARQGVSDQLEILCVNNAVSLLPYLPEHQFLTANVSPGLLKNPNLYCNIVSSAYQCRLKLELTEHLPVEDWEALREDMEMYQQSALEFWLDDTGCGYFGLQAIAKVRSAVVKLCITLVSRIASNQALVGQLITVVEHVHELGGLVLAEGVETREQEKLLKQINVDFAQGYYYGKPTPSADILS